MYSENEVKYDAKYGAEICDESIKNIKFNVKCSTINCETSLQNDPQLAMISQSVCKKFKFTIEKTPNML